MAVFDIHHPWLFVVGLLGTLISLMVYFAPIPTFYQILKKKSTEEFRSLPYIIALFSAMLWIYYAFLKTDYILITINSVGCIIETIYLAMFLTYAPRRSRIHTAKLLLLLNLGLFCLIILLTQYLAAGDKRVQVLGWICVAFSACVFVAPLSILRLVIRTRSVEFMPFYLSLFLTLSAIAWFSYGLLSKDLYVLLPNVGGFIFGVLQMGLYMFYRNTVKIVIEEKEKKVENVMDVVIDVVKLNTLVAAEIRPLETELIETGTGMFKDVQEQPDQNEKSVGGVPNE